VVVITKIREGVGGENLANHVYSTKHKLNIQVKQLRSTTYLNICLEAPLERPNIVMMPV
jgi:hypothetical protein